MADIGSSARRIARSSSVLVVGEKHRLFLASGGGNVRGPAVVAGKDWAEMPTNTLSTVRPWRGLRGDRVPLGEMSPCLGSDNPAVAQDDVALRRKRLDRVQRPVVQPVAVLRPAVGGHADAVADRDPHETLAGRARSGRHRPAAAPRPSLTTRREPFGLPGALLVEDHQVARRVVRRVGFFRPPSDGRESKSPPHALRPSVPDSFKPARMEAAIRPASPWVAVTTRAVLGSPPRLRLADGREVGLGEGLVALAVGQFLHPAEPVEFGQPSAVRPSLSALAAFL